LGKENFDFPQLYFNPDNSQMEVTMARKVVVVDDDAKVIMLIEKALKELDFEVFSANNGKKALELVKQENPELLITDILQPGLDGVQLSKLARELVKPAELKIIMVTGVYNESRFRLEMDCKVDAFIEKPIDINRLSGIIQEKILQV